MRIFCSGIGGIGLSAYASHMNARGHEVYGSDKNDSPLLSVLKSQGMTISLLQDGSAIPADTDLLVYSEAIAKDAPERRLASKRGIRQISYFAAVGELTAGSDLICICGTHGKSSTTAMTARVMIDMGLDPNVIVGTKMKELDGKNWRKGGGNLWIVEACEYRCSFHHLSPATILCTNADGDHFDAFASKEAYGDAFVRFFARLPDDGLIIYHGSDEEVSNLVKKSGKNGMDCDSYPLIALATPGVHMQQNAQLVLALAEQRQLDGKKALQILSGYSGCWRRMEPRGHMASGPLIIDDYAHHPTEIRATLKALRDNHPANRIVCVFQPHTHDRTLKLWNDFVFAFSDADIVVITDVYDARPDTETQLASTAELVEAIHRGSGKPAFEGKSLEETLSLLTGTILKKDDLLVTMGAGSIAKLPDMLLRTS